MSRKVWQPARIYVASSWKNLLLDSLIEQLRGRGHDVYDFRHADEMASFSFAKLGINNITAPDNARFAINTAPARAQLERDLDAIHAADVLILVNPCGRSAHFEAGYAVALGKRVVVLQDKHEPDLLYAMADRIETTLNGVIAALDSIAWELGEGNDSKMGFRK